MKDLKRTANISNMKFYTVLLSVCLFQVGTVLSQEQVYDDFDGKKVIHYGERSGVLDTAVKNPAPNSVNGSPTCALYVRNASKKFANIKMNVPQKLTGVEAFATYEGMPPRMKMKCYTTAPAGTLVEVLLGSKRGNNDYPAGTHSQYQAYTSVSNEWEELEFKFSQIPQGSETAANQIDQIVLLFNPNSSTSDSYYFDELTGPATAGPAIAPLTGQNAGEVQKGDDATMNTDRINEQNKSTEPKKTSEQKKRKVKTPAAD
jgi:hypothetical protein